MDHFTDAMLQMAIAAAKHQLLRNAQSLGIQQDQYEYNNRRAEEIKRKQMQAGAIEVETEIIFEDDINPSNKPNNNQKRIS